MGFGSTTLTIADEFEQRTCRSTMLRSCVLVRPLNTMNSSMRFTNSGRKWPRTCAAPPRLSGRPAAAASRVGGPGTGGGGCAGAGHRRRHATGWPPLSPGSGTGVKRLDYPLAGTVGRHRQPGFRRVSVGAAGRALQAGSLSAKSRGAAGGGTFSVHSRCAWARRRRLQSVAAPLRRS